MKNHSRKGSQPVKKPAQKKFNTVAAMVNHLLNHYLPSVE